MIDIDTNCKQFSNILFDFQDNYSSRTHPTVQELVSDLVYWLRDEYKCDTYPYNMYFGRYDKDVIPTTYYIEFDSPKHEMLFKLKYGV